jgi:putative membrane protein
MAIAAAGPNDAQFAAIVVTANQLDIDKGRLATSSSHNADVKSLAERTVIDHTAVNESAVDLAIKLKVTLQTTPAPRASKPGAENLRNPRSLADGGLFDSHAIEPARSWTLSPKKAGLVSYGASLHDIGTLRIE